MQVDSTVAVALVVSSAASEGVAWLVLFGMVAVVVLYAIKRNTNDGK